MAAGRFTSLGVAIAILCTATGCDVKEIEKVGAIYACDDFTLYPDSFVSETTAIAVNGDSVAIRGEGSARYLIISPDSIAGMSMSGDDGILNYLFNVATGVVHHNYDCFTPYEIYLTEALVNPDSAATITDSRLKGGRLAEYARNDYRWPIAMSDVTWGIAAATVSAMVDDHNGEMARINALRKVIDTDIEYVMDRDNGLFTGIPAEMDGKMIPQWANAADAAAMMTAEGNVSRIFAMRHINTILPGSYDPSIVDNLSRRISQLLWIPNLGMLSQTLYQRPYPISVTAADNLVQALAVTTKAVSNPMASRIVASTPMRANGVPVTYPDQGLENDTRRSVLTTAMWAVAAAKVGNMEAWRLSYSSLVSMAVRNEFALRMLRGVTLRTVFGIDPTPEGLFFHPVIDDALGESHTLSHFKYRNSDLTIKISGRGDEISSFAIDGKLSAKKSLSPDITGHHEVEIILVDGIEEIPSINIADAKTMPSPPEVITTRQRYFDIKSAETSQFIVYLNGVLTEIIERNSYELYNAAPVTAVSFEADVSNEVTGYASKNYLYIPASDSISITCKAVAHTGGRVLAKKDLAAKHVESTRFKNAEMAFDCRSAEGGDYFVRLRYLDGLGVVNKNRLYALRMLRVNNHRQGIMILPQRGPDKWSAAEDWATMIGTTLPVKVHLESGNNVVSVDYFAPDWMSDFDHDNNIIIPIALELIKI